LLLLIDFDKIKYKEKMTDKEKIHSLEEQVELLNKEKQALLETKALESFELNRQLKDKKKQMDENIIQLESSQERLREIEEKCRALEVERETLEKQLRKAQKMESIGTLAGGIAHDFNNILGIILGYAELALLEAPNNDTLNKNVEQLIQAVDRAKKLVKQILTFSREGDETPKPLVVNPIVKEVLEMLRSTLPTTINIQHYIQKEALTLLGNPTEVHQILMNLCTNAAQAMQGKAGILRVELKEIESPSGLSYLGLTVSDTGDGIPPDILERIFDPYFTTKKPGEGTGLGLSVVHGIVKRYGGGIKIDTKPGKGTTVTVKIPLIDVELKPKEVILHDIPTGDETILLVDDEEALLGTFKKILEQMNYTVITVDNSPEALEIFRKTPSRFHLVICDMTMPQMTGIQLAGELLSLRPDLPIILCTGFSEFVDAKKAKAVGIKEFLMKPFSKRALATTIRRVLDGK
jgi:signal transduction histidine kinase